MELYVKCLRWLALTCTTLCTQTLMKAGKLACTCSPASCVYVSLSHRRCRMCHARCFYTPLQVCNCVYMWVWTHQKFTGCDVSSHKHLLFIYPVVFTRVKEWREEKGGVLFLVKEWKNRVMLPLEGVTVPWCNAVAIVTVCNHCVFMRCWFGVSVIFC